MTAIFVTHDIRAAKVFSDRMVLIHEGNILAEGPLAELQKSQHPFVIQFLKDSS